MADSSTDQRFSTRRGLLLSVLGIAVGTGNIWHFPRIAATQSGWMVRRTLGLRPVKRET